jgi:8-oxo-dGTP pyrophosphatase MutT (NUDIX family)
MKNNNQQYCTNCGKTNHIYKECTYPIISYGILAFKINNNKIETLMVQRKDSLTFVEFMRGKYDIDDNTKLINLLTNMTNYEKKNILERSFDDLWKELWGEHLFNKNTICTQNMKRFQKEYFISKKKFTTYQTEIKNLINTIPKKYHDTEWGIAKGRRNLYENDINCAKREFLEETDLSEKDITLLNCNPIKERFLGSNGNRYEHVYYLAIFDSKKKIKINKNNYNQITEIKNIAWFNKTESLSKLRDYEIERYKIIEYAFNFIKNIFNI